MLVHLRMVLRVILFAGFDRQAVSAPGYHFALVLRVIFGNSAIVPVKESFEGRRLEVAADGNKGGARQALQ